jgi:hypothetical protein
LYAKLSKCEFWMAQESFLNKPILEEGISIDPSRT